MKKIIFLLTLSLMLFADNSKMIKSIIGTEKFNTYNELLEPVMNEPSLLKTLQYLQNNGLLDIFFDSPRLIRPTFVFTDNHPIFNTKILYDVLNSMGYFYFYPVTIEKSDNYKITLEMKSTHHIDPVLFIKSINQKGCQVNSIQKQKDFIFVLNCENAKLNALKVIDKKTKLINAKGIYWLNSNGFKKMLITTSKLDNWYPYVVFFDKNLNILNIIAKENSQKTIYLDIPQECAYIKISDNYSKTNFKRGIIIKGIK